MLSCVGPLLSRPELQTQVVDIMDRIKEVKDAGAPYANLMELLCWCRVCKWDKRLCEELVHAVHRSVAVLRADDGSEATDTLSSVEDEKDAEDAGSLMSKDVPKMLVD
jgi:hypothetical protein